MRQGDSGGQEVGIADRGPSILIDTVIFSDLFRGADEASRLAPHLEGQVAALSFQSVAELRYGAIKAGWGEHRRSELERRIRRCVVLAVDDLMVRAWAELRASAEAKGLPKQIGDLWIAATAKRHGIPLLTRDTGFFEGLDIDIVNAKEGPGPAAPR